MVNKGASAVPLIVISAMFTVTALDTTGGGIMVTYRWLSNKILKPQEERIRAKAQKEVQEEAKAGEWPKALDTTGGEQGMAQGIEQGMAQGRDRARTRSRTERRAGAGAAQVGGLVPTPRGSGKERRTLR